MFRGGHLFKEMLYLVSITVIPGETKVDGKLLRLSINKQIIERAFSAWSACTTLQTKRKWANILKRANFLLTTDLLSAKEYHSLVCLLCPDFPFEPVQKTARWVIHGSLACCSLSLTLERSFNPLTPRSD